MSDNPHIGSSLDELLQECRILTEVERAAMEKLTREVHAEFTRLLAGRPKRFPNRERR